MTLAAGKRLGSYEILALIGVGGMGEVYKARDTRLERTVAIKILPDHVAHDPDFRQRFEREAKTISSLSHPHICTLYDVGSDSGVDFLVMELLEGETLTQRLEKGALPFPQVLRYGIEIAEALDRAHRQGITHRDLKPGNVMITKAGAKLLDFGLAKLKPSSPVQLAGVAATAARDPLTASGTILGTLQYMAPEQVEGTTTDHRADIFSFGAIVYEMATGKKAFDGASQASLIGAILKDEPRPISTLQPLSPPGFDALIATCLAKDPDERWQSAGDVARQLRLLQGGSSQPSIGLSQVLVGRREPRRAWPVALGVFALGALLAGTTVYTLSRPLSLSPRPVTRLVSSLLLRSASPAATISRDGARVGFLSADSPLIQVRDLDAFEARTIPGTEDASQPPCFSPDGQWIAYSVNKYTELRRMSLAGGAALTLVTNGSGVDFCDWGEDGYIYFGSGVGISRVPEGGGSVESIVEADPTRGELTVERPRLLPGGRHLLVNAFGATFEDVRVTAIDLANHEQTIVLRASGIASFVPSGPDGTQGYLVHATGNVLLAAPFDVERLTAGTTRPVEIGVSTLVQGLAVALSDTGTLAYLTGVSGFEIDDSQLVWVTRDGAEQALAEAPHSYGDVQLSPDGRRVAVNILEEQNFTADLWVYDLDGERLAKLTFGGADVAPVWMPDGRRIAYASAPSFPELLRGISNVRHVPADNSAGPQMLVPASRQRGFYPAAISRDGTVLAVTSGAPGGRDIAVLTLSESYFAGTEGSAGEPREFLATNGDEWSPTFSPDGRYLAYTSNESGSEEVYVVPYPGPGGRSLVSRGGGSMPRWNPSGRELFYLSPDNELMVASVETVPGFSASTPSRLFTMPPIALSRGWGYDVAVDGTRFIVRKLGAPPSPEIIELRVVVNWIEELERSMAGDR